MRARSAVAIGIAVGVLGVVAAGCSGDDDGAETPTLSVPTTTATSTAQAPPAETAATTPAETGQAAPTETPPTGPTPTESAPAETAPTESGAAAPSVQGEPPEVSQNANAWPSPNKDLHNTRVATGSTISSETVDQLEQIWTSPITGGGNFGSFAATPIVAGGVVYLQDLSSNVWAVDLATGEELWRMDYDEPSVGPNGVAIGYGKVFGATATFAFALDMATGEEVWRTEPLVRNEKEGIDMAPGVHDGRVYVSTVPGNASGFYEGNGQGILYALDAETGETAWTFDTVPADLWGNPDVNSGGGLWHPPAFDDEGGVYVSVANPAPWPGTEEFPWATSRPGPNEYTNSLVKLDAQTGELQWFNQVLPHDVYDWDLQLPPILTEMDGQQVEIVAGKMGYVYAIDANGELLWKTAVGEHNGHDEDHVAAMALTGPDDQDGLANMPDFPLELLPGVLGGVETQMAVADGVVYAPVVNLPVTFTSQTESELDFTGGTGQMVALDVATGDVLWDVDFDTPVYGGATVVNDLLLTTTFDGTLRALDRSSGEEVWSQELPASTNSVISVAGDVVVTAAGFPQGEGQTAQIVAFGLPGTGGTDTGQAPTPTESTATESTPAEPTPAETGATETGGGTDTSAAGGGADGESLFVANCAGCHTLAAAGTSGSVGPNLDQSSLDEDAMREQIANGGGGMPAFAGRLTDEEIAAIAAYVAGARNPDAGDSGGGGMP
ncbi:MAG: PQQ-binding-like beta-propeller repeat protein [Thermoleophilia bacterium]